MRDVDRWRPTDKSVDSNVKRSDTERVPHVTPVFQQVTVVTECMKEGLRCTGFLWQCFRQEKQRCKQHDTDDCHGPENQLPCSHGQ